MFHCPSHYIAFGITLAMMVVMNWYVYYTMDRRDGPADGATWCNKYGPFVCTMIAAPLVLADQARHVTQDLGWWPAGPWPGSSEYISGCGSETMACLSPLGWGFTSVFTYTGFLFIAIGTMWNANMVDKCRSIRSKWNELRGNEDDEKKTGLLVNTASATDANAV